MELDSPPLLDRLLLESPWALMVVCVVAALILFSTGQRRRKKPLLFCAGLALGAAFGVYFLSQVVTTHREQLMQETRSLVAATAPLDNAVLNRLLDPNAVVTGPDGAVWLNAGDVLPRVQRVLSNITINSQDIRRINALAHDPTRGESVITIRTDAQGSGVGPLNTGWHLYWQRSDDDASSLGGWRVVDIRWMRFNGVETPHAMMP